MTSARFRLELPDETWITDLTNRFPEARFRLLAGLHLEEEAVELGEARAADVGRVSEAVRTHPAVHDYDSVLTETGRAVAKYTTSDTSLYALLGSHSLPPDFPIEVHDGSVEFDVTGSREQLASFSRALAASDLDSDVRWVVDAPSTSDLLTSRQREAIETAVSMGYYEVPRACTLSELAAELDVDKSTASGILRRANGRIVGWFLDVGGNGRELAA